MTAYEARPTTRRAVIAGAIAGTVALAASTLGRPAAVRAHDPDDVALGQVNTAAHSTEVECLVEGGPALAGHSALGDGVYGQSDSTDGGKGVYGFASTASDAGNVYGVYGESASPGGTGVYGYSSATTSGAGVGGWCDSADGVGVAGSGGARGVWGDSEGTGVFGHAGDQGTGVLGFAGVITMGVPAPDPAPKTGVFGISFIDAQSVGVLGQSTVGTGVRAIATTGTALYATTASAKSGTALRTVGRVRFDNSVGIASVAAGRSSVTVTPGIDLSSSSAVVATLQANPSGTIAVQGVVVDTASNTFRIFLTGTASAAMKVAWHVFG